jgi:hypothetical protein
MTHYELRQIARMRPLELLQAAERRRLALDARGHRSPLRAVLTGLAALKAAARLRRRLV